LGQEEFNPVSVMNETILNERYDAVGNVVREYLAK
jgi:hypothetical protein